MKYHFFRGKSMKFLHRIQQGILAVCLGVLLGVSFAESQAAELKIGDNIYCVQRRGRQGGVWKDKHDGNPLNAKVLARHLEIRGENCLKELGRLILAQGIGDTLVSYPHNVPENADFSYMDNSACAADLHTTPILSALIDHLFDHGHLGWYPYVLRINMGDFHAIVDVNPQVAPRGIFNIGPIIRDRILPEIQSWFQELALSVTGNIILRGVPLREIKGYAVDLPSRGNPNLRGAAINLITCLFSSDAFESVNFGRIEYVRNSRTNARFNIYATYNGGPIQGIDYTHPTGSPPPDNCLGLQSNGTPTNRICLVVGVYNGTIYIASLFPIEEA